MKQLPRSGVLVVVGVFVLGTLMLVGFFLAPRGRPTDFPTTTTAPSSAVSRE